MQKILAIVLFVFSTNPAFAEACPPSYRFVDFGVQGSDGVLRRGGTIFRAFDANGTGLLLRDQSICRQVDELSKDGRALPIPVVASVNVDLAVAGLDLTALQLATQDDAFTFAEQNAGPHRDRLALPDATTVRGDTYLCASSAESGATSCQIVSPYAAIAPLVIYCDAGQCRMPVLARDEKFVVSATWPSAATGPEALAQEIIGKVQTIHAFLEDQI